jgi:hypothetical protein
MLLPSTYIPTAYAPIITQTPLQSRALNTKPIAANTAFSQSETASTREPRKHRSLLVRTTGLALQKAKVVGAKIISPLVNSAKIFARPAALTGYTVSLLLPGMAVANTAVENTTHESVVDVTDLNTDYFLSVFGPKTQVDATQAQTLAPLSHYATHEVSLNYSNITKQEWDNDFVDLVQAYTWGYYAGSIQPTKESIKRWLDITHAAFLRTSIAQSTEQTVAIITDKKLVPAREEIFLTTPATSLKLHIKRSHFPVLEEAYTIESWLRLELYLLEEAHENENYQIYANGIGRFWSQLEKALAQKKTPPDTLMKNVDYGLRKKSLALCIGKKEYTGLIRDEAIILDELLSSEYAETSWIGQKKKGKDFEETRFADLDESTRDYLQKSLSLLFDRKILPEHLEFAFREFKKATLGHGTPTDRVSQGSLTTIHTLLEWRAHILAELELVPTQFADSSSFQLRTDKDSSLWQYLHQMIARTRTLPQWQAPSFVEQSPSTQRKMAQEEYDKTTDLLNRTFEICVLFFFAGLLKLNEIFHHNQRSRFLHFSQRSLAIIRKEQAKIIIKKQQEEQARREALQKAARVRLEEHRPERIKQQQPKLQGPKLVVIDGAALDRAARIAAYEVALEEDSADDSLTDTSDPETLNKTEAPKKAKAKKPYTEIVEEHLRTYERYSVEEVVAALKEGSPTIEFSDTKLLQKVQRSPQYRSFLRTLIELKYFYMHKKVREQRRKVQRTISKMEFYSVKVSQGARLCFTKDNGNITIHFLGTHREYERFLSS